MSTLKLVFLATLAVFVLVIFVLSIIRTSCGKVLRKLRKNEIDLPLRTSGLIRSNLDRAGLNDVEVKESVFRFGYNHRKRVIYYTSWYERKLTTLSAAMAMQAVATAIYYNIEGNIKRGWGLLRFFTFTSTLFFVLTSIIGLFVVLLSTVIQTQLICVILLGVSLVIYIILTIFNIKKRKIMHEINATSEKIMSSLEIFTEKELKDVHLAYEAIEKREKINTVLAALFMVYFFLKFLYKFFGLFSKKK